MADVFFLFAFYFGNGFIFPQILGGPSCSKDLSAPNFYKYSKFSSISTCIFLLSHAYTQTHTLTNSHT